MNEEGRFHSYTKNFTPIRPFKMPRLKSPHIIIETKWFHFSNNFKYTPVGSSAVSGKNADDDRTWNTEFRNCRAGNCQI